MVDHRELFDGVCAVLERAGLALAAPGHPGLRVGHEPAGVVVSVTDGTVRSGRADGGAARTTGVTWSLAALLVPAGFAVTGQSEGRLLVTGRAG